MNGSIVLLLQGRLLLDDSCKQVFKTNNLTLDEQGGTNCPPIDMWDWATLEPILTSEDSDDIIIPDIDLVFSISFLFFNIQNILSFELNFGVVCFM
jgi:hypothetical protein